MRRYQRERSGLGLAVLSGGLVVSIRGLSLPGAGLDEHDVADRVPHHFTGDVAVVGFDNQELIAAQLRPVLSTVALPYYEMGRWAVSHQIEQSEHGRATPTRHTIGCRYVERESV